MQCLDYQSTSLAAQIALSSWGTVLKPVAFTRHLCFGPNIGQKVQFTHPDTWMKKASKFVEPEAATADITRRFLAVYGPATDHDLARWWGGGGTRSARQWMAALGEEVCAVDLGGAKAWMLAADARELSERQPKHSVRLLPGFDQYVAAASRHAEHLLPRGLRSRIYRRQGWLSPVLLVDGMMQGVWRHEIKREPRGGCCGAVR